MTISKKVDGFIEKSSWIRKMFEEGAKLRAEHGADRVFDFSLGNPNLPPPDAFQAALADTVAGLGPMDHAYMPNTGYPHVREAVARVHAVEQAVPLTADDVIMTCGAAGALNVTLKSILDPGDEVLTPAPCFVEYGFYADNHGGVLKTVPTQPDFSLDLPAMADAIGPKTKAVIINSPNNPTGQIYSEESLMALGELLTDRCLKYGRIIYLISDEPYRKIVYDGVHVPSVLACYANSILATSHSKDLSIPGERLGVLAVNPASAHNASLIGAMALANRILGFVNAPALMQRVVGAMTDATVDVGAYDRKRTLLCDGLAEAGYDFQRPPGAFYLFPRSPVPDDVAFVRALQEELILVVPGSGFMGPGHFRISYCVDDAVIVNALPGFKRAIAKFK